MEYLLALLPLGALLLALSNALHKRRLGKQRDFARKLELVLLPRETIKVICPQRGRNCVLTSKRVLFENRNGFTAVAVKDIKRTSGLTEEGKKTTYVPRMVSLTIKAGEEHTIVNTGEEFLELARLLTAKVKKQNEKKKKAASLKTSQKTTE